MLLFIPNLPIRFICILVLATFTNGLLERPEPTLPKKGLDRPQSMPVNDEEMTRLLSIDYSFRGESVLYNVLDRKPDTPSTVISGNFTFETLHHDSDGGMLARFTLTKCTSGNCGVVPPVIAYFRQGGNNIESMFVETRDFPDYKPTWNSLFGIVNSIYTPAAYGEGDEQFVPTVYGNCRVHFGRPEDKKFRRKINSCDVGNGRNVSRFGGLEIVDYTQDTWYIQNTKVDADIVIVDAIESLEMRVPFDRNKWGFVLESRLHVEIHNRTRLYVKRHCLGETNGAICAQEAFGATRVGIKLYENVTTGLEAPPSELAMILEEYRHYLENKKGEKMAKKNSEFFARLVQAANKAEDFDWMRIVYDPKNEKIRNVLANVLGAVGSVETLKTFQEDLSKVDKHGYLLDDYLFGAAHSLSRNEKWHKKLMYWLAEEAGNEKYWKIANTIATILRKRCESTTSTWNACNKDKEKIVSKFIHDVAESCSTDECYEKALEVLENLPILRSFNVAKSLLCSNHSAQTTQAALLTIERSPKEFYNTELIRILIRIFRNTCPRESSTAESQLAVDILIKCVPDHQHAATLLLRTETLNPENHELWQYLYKTVKSSGEKDELKAEFWRRMRQFKVFRPNYAQRALNAGSYRHWASIAEAAAYNIQQNALAEFSDGDVFKRSKFSIDFTKGKKDEELFSLLIASNGLEAYLSKGSEKGAKVDESQEDHTIDGRGRLSILSHNLPTYTLYKGVTGMAAAVWNANGENINAFEGAIPLRDSSFSVPLLSGLSLDVKSRGAIALRIDGSADVSLWDRAAAAEIRANATVSLLNTAVLIHNGKAVRSIDSTFSLQTAILSNTDTVFAELPYDYCLTFGMDDLHVSYKTIMKDSEKPRKKLVESKHTKFPGATFRLDQTITERCNAFHRAIMKN